MGFEDLGLLGPGSLGSPWSALLYRSAEGPLGVDLLGPDDLRSLLATILVPSMMVLPRTREARLIRSRTDVPSRLGDQMFVLGPDGYLDELVERVSEQRRIERMNGVLTRAGRPSRPVPESGVDDILSAHPRIVAPASSSPRFPHDRPRRMWLGRRSSLGGMLVGVGIGVDELVSRLDPGLPTGVERRVVRASSELPAW